MFAYCGNNPVNSLDPAGTICWAIFGDNHLFNPNMLADFGGGGGSYDSGGVSTRGRTITLKEFLNTEDPAVVFEHLEKYGMSYYKGVPVFQASLGDGGGFSFGIIILDDNYTNNRTGIDTLNHEYGHRLHMDDIGVISYALTTVAPSLLHAGLANLGLVKNYYSLPWERIADMYGGVNRNNYVSGAEEKAVIFWMYTVLVSKLTERIP